MHQGDVVDQRLWGNRGAFVIDKSVIIVVGHVLVGHFFIFHLHVASEQCRKLGGGHGRPDVWINLGDQISQFQAVEFCHLLENLVKDFPLSLCAAKVVVAVTVAAVGQRLNAV